MAMNTLFAIGNIEAFDPDKGDDWPIYAERMDHYFTTNDIDNDEKKRAVFLTVIGIKAYGLLQNLLAPVDTEYATLIKTRKDYLSPKPLI